jgi:hypothetical protein
MSMSMSVFMSVIKSIFVPQIMAGIISRQMSIKISETTQNLPIFQIFEKYHFDVETV